MIYRKHGTVARSENGTLIRVTESGVAIEEGEYFECAPMWSAATPVAALDCGSDELPRALSEMKFERLIITHGVAEHECEARTWREETSRLHASITHGTLRALVDQSTFDMTLVEQIAAALQRAEPRELKIERVVLEPNVTAALLPHLVNRTPNNVRLVQTAGGVDGYGNPIVEAESDWPNAYRPSYRMRPVRMPHNLRIECDDTTIDDHAPRAIALLAPISDLTIKVLVVDGRRVYPATITVKQITAVATDRIWYPYGAGSFGAAMML